MMLWLVLFVLVVAASFMLAFRSMKDFQQLPRDSKLEYGLFLIRQPLLLDEQILNTLHQRLLSENLIISFERLFKGREAALTVFGPKKILESFRQPLDLLELEDYTNDFAGKDYLAWEVVLKNNKKFHQEPLGSIFQTLTNLGAEEQFFWQVVLEANKDKNFFFRTQIRAVFLSKDHLRSRGLIPGLQNMGKGKLIRAELPFSSSQMVSFYKSRGLGKDSKGPLVSARDLLSLLRVN